MIEKSEAWRVDYDQSRPHLALEEMTPAEFAGVCRTSELSEEEGRAGNQPSKRSGNPSGSALTRVAGLQESAGTTSVWFLGIVVVGTGASSARGWVPIQSEHLGWLVGVGAAGALGQWLLTAAFARGSPGRVAPLEYTALLWAFLFDWLMFTTVPSTSQVAAGLLVVLGGSLLLQARTPAAHRSARLPRR
ncbi:MAG: EamA family transporter, partial [Pseudomonadota bacterium]